MRKFMLKTHELQKQPGYVCEGKQLEKKSRLY